MGFGSVFLMSVAFLGLWRGANGQMDLGKMETWDNFNDVDSEMITMMSPKQLMIRKFEYNGDGPGKQSSNR